MGGTESGQGKGAAGGRERDKRKRLNGRREWEGQEGGAGGMEAGGKAGGSGKSRREGREGWKQWEGREGRDRVSSATSPVSPHICSGDGSATSGASEEVKSPAAMAQAVKVHQDTSRVMYFA